MCRHVGFHRMTLPALLFCIKYVVVDNNVVHTIYIYIYTYYFSYLSDLFVSACTKFCQKPQLPAGRTPAVSWGSGAQAKRYVHMVCTKLSYKYFLAGLIFTYVALQGFLLGYTTRSAGYLGDKKYYPHTYYVKQPNLLSTVL